MILIIGILVNQLHHYLRKVNNIEDKIIKAEIVVNKIMFPKYQTKVESGEFAIFSSRIVKPIEDTCEAYQTLKLKGNVCKLECGTVYKVTCKLADHHEKYGDTYEILYIGKKIDISSKDKQKEFLSNILNENIVDNLFDTYDDVIKLLDDHDVESLIKVKGIGNSTALRLIDEYEDAKDYSAIYTELGKIGLTSTLIKKLVDFYRSPDTVIDVVKNNPYDLVKVDGIGFKKADEIATKMGIGQYDFKRIKGFLLYTLQDQGEAGKSYLYYTELLKIMYDVLGFVPEEVINQTAKSMMDCNDVVVFDNGDKIALKRYYDLEVNIAKEIKRLMIGKVKSEETELQKSDALNDYGILDDELMNKPYEPKSFNISNWKEIVSEVEEEQGYEFTDEQTNAIKMSLDNNVMNITGLAGCVDCDTEFFNGHEWKRIADYKKGDKVLQYNDNGTTTLVEPLNYIKQHSDNLWHFKTKYGLDQCLSDNHNCYYITSKGNLYNKKFREIRDAQQNNKNGFLGKFITAFNYSGDGIPYTNDDIRLFVAIIADGSYNYSADINWDSYNRCYFNLKKERKIERLRMLLDKLHIKYIEQHNNENGYTRIRFDSMFRIKEFPKEWYNCTQEQLQVICDELIYWDGDFECNKNRISTTIKSNADFIQWCYTATGKRSTININDRRGNIKIVDNKQYEQKSIDYDVVFSDNVLVSMCTDDRPNHTKTKIEQYKTTDGYEYCFTVPSHILVLRRNNKIFVTGNCGKTSTANGICKLYDHYEIVAVALSGKASVRITEATGLPASTIHRALGYAFGSFEYNRNNKLPVDIVLVDEATMINGSLFLSLLEAIPSGAKVIIMGDVQQLTPIGNCQVFADILDSGIVPTVRLTKPHRQALRSGIIPTSINVAKQEQIFNSTFEGKQILGELQDMEIDIYKNKADMSEDVISHFQTELSKINDVMEVQIVVPMKLKGSLSCYNLNTQIQTLYNPVMDDDFIDVALTKIKDVTNEEYKGYKLHIGDKVINTKNNYKCVNSEGKITPVFNGNIGIVTNIENQCCTVNFIGIGEIILSKKETNSLELGYAISIHKSQGSGFHSAIVAIDGTSYILNNAELLYTGLTRAKKYCVLIGKNSAIHAAISKKEVKKKQTFLKELLQKEDEI